MATQADIRYTKLDSGDWVIESTSVLPLVVIQGAMSFVDDDFQKHTIKKIFRPEGNPEAPYYYFMGAEVED